MSADLRFLKKLQISIPDGKAGLLAVKASGTAKICKLYKPVLVPRNQDEIPEDGILELDFRLVPADDDSADVEMEVDLVLNKDELPSWVKGLRVHASENSDIELI